MCDILDALLCSSCDIDNFTDAAVTGRINGEHKEKDLEPWDGGDTHNSDSLESLDTDVVRSIPQTQQTCWYQLETPSFLGE